MPASTVDTSRYPSLAKPVQLGAITTRNGCIMASLTRNRSGPGERTNSIPNDDNLDYYLQRAIGGVGLILTEGTLISQQGSEWPYAAGLFSEEHVPAWKKIVDAVHKEGCPIVLQSWHVGRIARPDQDEAKKSGQPVMAPSAVKARGGKFRELDNAPHATPTAVDDPRTILADYRRQAELAKKCGFDGIEVHSANGYLINQFLDKNTNQRTDEWGGSVEKRARFGIEVTKIMCEVFGADRVGMKLNPCGGYNDVGMPLDEQIAQFKYYISEVDKLGIAYFQLVRYVEKMDPTYDDKEGPRGTKHDVVATYTPIMKNAKILLNGNFDAKEADETIKNGTAAAVVFGTPWISNPDYYERAQLDIELADGNPKTFYVGEPENKSGYTDYAFAPETPSGQRAVKAQA